MARKKATQKKPTKSPRRIEALGWLFYAIVFGILIIPSIYLSFQVTQDDAPVMAPLGIGTLVAAILAGIISWLANTALQAYYSKRRAAERKAGKKK